MEATTPERQDFIRYPTNRVVGTIADAKNAHAAINALLHAGFDRQHIDILHGDEDVRRLDPTGALTCRGSRKSSARGTTGADSVAVRRGVEQARS